ncbi:MAG: DNA internalization-related competence protein ComEC/Rec2 [Aquabacterium sp.]|uniref:DNA internalization-related competence protein ComEC/Rec2 n=1 Tax=Aquabacterium sp. TaxID=1872578 RepID=UPI0025BC07B8|nr:DNA internalization-related competence protein ComEC/Rec2 [Aquabacterium sp.]MBI5926275.1 DNA internalization-related competence protein ComEC/Rec2 [Aquabacterium sp.]
MGVSLVWALAWLLGVFAQTGQTALHPMWVDAVSAAVSLGILAWTWLKLRTPVGAVGTGSPWWRWACLGMGSMAMLALAWSTTGWRASMRMLEGVPDAWAGHPVQVTVQVEGLPLPVPGGALLDARVLRWGPDVGATNNWPTHLSLRMPLAEGVLPMAGQQWQFTVQLHAPDGLSNPGAYDGTLSYFERGVRAVGSVRRAGQPARLQDLAPERPWQGVIDRWRQRVRTAVFSHVADQRAAGILTGLSVGDQSAIDREDWDLFRQTGVAHLVSISGAHIAMFGWMAAVMVRRAWSLWPTGMHRWPAPDVAMWVAVGASGLYALVSGWGIPAQRTVFMMALVCWLRSGGRRWPWPLVWLSSAVVLTALDPWAIRQAGFWLSYVAVGVLLSYGMKEIGLPGSRTSRIEAGAARVSQRVSVLAGRMAMVCVNVMKLQCLITLALLPLSLVVFQQASLSSLLANLIAIPVFTIGITPLSLLGTIWAPSWDLGAWVISGLMSLLAQLVLTWPAMAESPVLPWPVVLFGVLAGGALALPMHWRWRLGLLPFGLPLLYVPQSWHLLPAPRPGAFELLAADVGQGTAVLIRTAHHNLLFDTGPRIGEQLNAGDRTLLPLFRALGVSKLHALVISHQDTDHVGGADAILHQMPVDQLVSSLDEAHGLRHTVGVHGRPVSHQACQAGMQWQWDGVRFEVLYPDAGVYAHREGRAPNAMSCVLKVSASDQGARSVLLTGDIEADQEAALVQREAGRLRSTVLVAAHHGSQTSSTARFLQAVQPEQVVIQVGRRNRYGHPSPSVLARYEAMSLNWVASPACGAYIWSSNEQLMPVAGATLRGGTPRVGTCWRPAHHRYWDEPSPMASPHVSVGRRRSMRE